MTQRRCTLPPSGPAAGAAAAHRATLPVLETARLRLRPPTLRDLPAWTEIFAGEPFGIGPEDAWLEFGTYTAGWLLHGHGLWAVERHDGILVGFVHVGLEWEDEEPELGWMLLPSHRGNGYATEAAEAARTYGATLLDTLVSYIDPDNTASSAVAARVGGRRDDRAETALDASGQGPVQVWRHLPAWSEARP